MSTLTASSSLEVLRTEEVTGYTATSGDLHDKAVSVIALCLKYHVCLVASMLLKDYQ